MVYNKKIQHMSLEQAKEETGHIETKVNGVTNSPDDGVQAVIGHLKKIDDDEE